jgi:hypothetical protein
LKPGLLRKRLTATITLSTTHVLSSQLGQLPI